MRVPATPLHTAFAAALVALLAGPGAGGQPVDAPGWRTVEPGGHTGCAFGTPFEFWVHEGDPARVLLFLQGGGACWDRQTCDPSSPTLRFDPWITASDTLQRVGGVFDPGASNPFRDFTMIFVPYCTGDFHLGGRRVRYAGATPSDTAIVVRHSGFDNVRAVLDHLGSRPVPAGTVVVAGASAGAVASPVVAAEVARRLPGAVVRQIGDGAAGLRVPQARSMLGGWGADSVLTTLGLPLRLEGDVLTGMYITASRRAPRIRFLQVATAEDAVVAGGLRLIGAPGSVAANVARTYAGLRSAGVCFQGFTLPGEVHTILWRPELLSARLGGDRLVDRIAAEVRAESCSEPAGSAALLFTYRPKPGLEAEFARGYRRHLDWHAANADSLPWLAWTVVTGDRPGLFVDGTFGISLDAFDRRVDPAGDAADAAINVTAFADPVSRSVYRAVSAGTAPGALETGRPGALQEVLSVSVRPGSGDTFVGAVRSAAIDEAWPVSLYELVSGGGRPGYLLIIQMAAWADLERAADRIQRILRDAGPVVVHASSEVWAYRPDLSLLPNR